MAPPVGRPARTLVRTPKTPSRAQQKTRRYGRAAAAAPYGGDMRTHGHTSGNTPCGTSPRTWCPAHPKRMIGSPTASTPRRQRPRMTTADGRSPGSRVSTPPPSRDPRAQWTYGGRFAAYSSGGCRSIERLIARTAFPVHHRREPSHKIKEIIVAVSICGETARPRLILGVTKSTHQC